MKINLFDLPQNKYFIGLNKEFNELLMKNLKITFSPLYRNSNRVLGISDSNLYSLYRRRQYQLSLFGRIIDILKIDPYIAQKNVIYIKNYGTSKIAKPKFPIKLSKSLARIIAHLLGDGHLGSKNNKTIKGGYYNQEKILRESFKEDLSKIFKVKNIQERINKTTPFVLIPSSASWILFQIIRDYNSYTARVPKFIKESTKPIKKEFIMAFLDDEAHVRYAPPNRNIEITLSNSLLLEDVKELLREFNVGLSKTYHKKIRGFNVYYFFIKNYHNIKRYHDTIGCLHPKKRFKLLQIIKNPGRKSYAKNETEDRILHLLKKGLKTSNEISKELNRKLPNTNIFLNRLNKKDIIEKVGFKKLSKGNREVIWGIMKIKNGRTHIKRKT